MIVPTLLQIVSRLSVSRNEILNDLFIYVSKFRGLRSSEMNHTRSIITMTETSDSIGCNEDDYNIEH